MTVTIYTTKTCPWCTKTKEFLKKNKINTLYNTLKKFPEYKKDYYAVFFEDPDKIKLEVTYVPNRK